MTTKTMIIDKECPYCGKKDCLRVEYRVEEEEYNRGQKEVLEIWCFCQNKSLQTFNIGTWR